MRVVYRAQELMVSGAFSNGRSVRRWEAGFAPVCAVVLGATIDYFLPTAQTLPQAVKIFKAQW